MTTPNRAKSGSANAATPKERIVKALASTGLGNFITLAAQLILVPVFLRSWGQDKYGQWLIISSIPSYLALSDFGILAASGNAISMALSLKDHQAVRKQHAASVGVVKAVSLVGVIAILIFGVTVASGYFNFFDSSSGTIFVFSALVLYAIASISTAPYLNIMRGLGNNHLALNLISVARILELVLTGVLLLRRASPTSVAFGLLATRLIAAVYIRNLTSKMYRLPDCKTSLSELFTLFSQLRRSAAGFMMFPIANLVATNGTVAFIGVVFTPADVVVFATSRTLTRVPTQLANSINTAVWPELSFSWAQRQFSRYIRIATTAVAVSTLASVVGAMLIWCFTSEIYKFWLKGALSPTAEFITSMSVYAIASSFSAAAAISMISVNKTVVIGLAFIASPMLAMITYGALWESRDLTTFAAVLAAFEVISGLIIVIHAVASIKRELRYEDLAK